MTLSPISAARHRPAEYCAVALIASAVSVASFLYYFRQDQLLLYGDAVAHMNIARRVIDSRTPGPLQLGTVWLPLPHVLMLPFIGSTWAWRTGVAGAIPSMLAYVWGALGLWRLVRRGLEFVGANFWLARFTAGFATAVYVANPNLIYLQATAMTEPLYLALFIWSTIYFAEFFQHTYRGDDTVGQRALVRCGVVLLLAMLTRYDGWFVAAAYGIAALLALIVIARRRGLQWFALLRRGGWLRTGLTFAALLVAPPAVWLAYNYAAFGNPVEFATGPYSARTIVQRTEKPGSPHHPGWNSPAVAAAYFQQSAKLNLAGARWQRHTWLWAAMLGSVALLVFLRPLWPWLLLWAPVPFYALSIAWGGVPIFLPIWWPFSYYNVRYGTQLLPAIAALFAVLVYFGLLCLPRARWRMEVVAVATVFVTLAYAAVWRQTPICLREAIVNSRTRVAFEAKLAFELARLPGDSTLLIYTGNHGGALQRIGLPLRRTINEGNSPAWREALNDPAQWAEYIVAAADDPLAAAVQSRPQGLEKIAVIESPGQPTTVIYRSMSYRAPAQ